MYVVREQKRKTLEEKEEEEKSVDTAKEKQIDSNSGRVFLTIKLVVKLIEPTIYNEYRSRITCPNMIDIQLTFERQVGTGKTKTIFRLVQNRNKTEILN